jgi:putative hydrolase of the HAD superfamily
MTTIRAVLFDYGMVLSGPADPVAWARMQAILGVSEGPFDVAYWRHRYAYDRGALSGVAYWRQVGEDVGRPVDEAMLAELIAADTALWTQENLPMIAWAQELQRRGVKTGILSNLGDAMEAGIRERFGWLEGFAHHTFSHRLGIAKPDATIYAHAAEGLGVAPDEVLFVDDRETNVRGAREAGMVGVVYAGHAEFLEEMRVLGLGWLL